MSDKTRRQLWADVTKGIGIILVIIGHIDLPNAIINYIFAFHMPLFIIISGYFVNHSRISNGLKKLAICYINMSVIMTVAYSVFEYITTGYTIRSVLRQFLNILLGASAPHYRVDAAPAVWFFVSLIVIQIISFFQSKITKKIQPLVPIICLIFGLLLSRYKDNSYLPFNIDVSLLLYPFFYIGSNFKSVIKNLLDLSKWWVILVFVLTTVITILISIYNGEVNIYRCNYGNSIVLYYIGSLAGAISIIALSKVVSEFTVMKPIIWLGQNTIVPMCCHQLCIIVLGSVLAKLSLFNTVINTIILFIFVMLIAIVATLFVNKFVPELLGTKRRL